MDSPLPTLLSVAVGLGIISVMLGLCYEALALMTNQPTITTLVRMWSGRNPLWWILLVLVTGVLVGHFAAR